MKKTALSLVAAVMVAGCATPAYVSPVEVTRFVSETPAYLGQGTITLEAAPGTMAVDVPEDVAPAEAALRRLWNL